MTKKNQKSQATFGVQSKHPGGRKPCYPFDRWFNGKQHTIDYKKLGKTREAVTEALRRRARKLGGHVEVYQAGGTDLDVKYFSKGH